MTKYVVTGYVSKDKQRKWISIELPFDEAQECKDRIERDMNNPELLHWVSDLRTEEADQ
jgi:uncharacterized membrane-anchored protein